MGRLRTFDLELFRVMYERGDSLDSMMKALGVKSRSTLKGARRALKLTRRSSGWHRAITKERWDAIEDAVRRGLKVAVIKKQLRTCNTMVARVRRHMKSQDQSDAVASA